MKALLVIVITILSFSCSQDFFAHCEMENYLESYHKNINSGFQNQQRIIYTSFSEQELETLFKKTNMSCKEILLNFFYCNMCFNNDVNYLITYSGKRVDLENTKDPNVFTDNLIKLISSMKIGSNEHIFFLNSIK
tara:strand:- start:94 stop:498 length:405 start_codon:yes stop_codon:yes gene_type:complete